jgi:hypothetical protein
MFQKGKSGNPAGRPRLPEDVRKAMAQDSAEFHRILSKVVRMDRTELTNLTKSADASVMELMVASLAVKAVKEGDQNRLRFLAERIAGKVPDKIEWEGDAPASGQQISHALIFQSIQSITKTKEGEE